MTDYKLEFMTQTFWSGKVTEFLRQCYAVLLTQFNLKLVMKFF